MIAAAPDRAVATAQLGAISKSVQLEQGSKDCQRGCLPDTFVHAAGHNDSA